MASFQVTLYVLSWEVRTQCVEFAEIVCLHSTKREGARDERSAQDQQLPKVVSPAPISYWGQPSFIYDFTQLTSSHSPTLVSDAESTASLYHTDLFLL